jgi:hypothetical protein
MEGAQEEANPVIVLVKLIECDQAPKNPSKFSLLTTAVWCWG